MRRATEHRTGTSDHGVVGRDGRLGGIAGDAGGGRGRRRARGGHLRPRGDRLRPGMAAVADLVLCMAAEHRDQVLEFDEPQAVDRTFTLKRSSSGCSRAGRGPRRRPRRGSRRRRGRRRRRRRRRGRRAPGRGHRRPAGAAARWLSRDRLRAGRSWTVRLVPALFDPVPAAVSGGSLTCGSFLGERPCGLPVEGGAEAVPGVEAGHDVTDVGAHSERTGRLPGLLRGRGSRRRGRRRRSRDRAGGFGQGEQIRGEQGRRHPSRALSRRHARAAVARAQRRERPQHGCADHRARSFAEEIVASGCPRPSREGGTCRGSRRSRRSNEGSSEHA